MNNEAISLEHDIECIEVIKDLLAKPYTPKQPYAHNVLLRIRMELDERDKKV